MRPIIVLLTTEHGGDGTIMTETPTIVVTCGVHVMM